jgi:cytochrome b subunit of formate dehydrogenase
MTNLRRSEEYKMRKKWIFLAPLMMLIFIAIGGEVVLHLWNWLLPALFGWRQITFWQALGLLALCRILFGGLGGHGFHRSNFRRRMAGRWEQMTPEEREKFHHGLARASGTKEPA